VEEQGILATSWSPYSLEDNIREGLPFPQLPVGIDRAGAVARARTAAATSLPAVDGELNHTVPPARISPTLTQYAREMGPYVFSILSVAGCGRTADRAILSGLLEKNSCNVRISPHLRSSLPKVLSVEDKLRNLGATVPVRSHLSTVLVGISDLVL
jgi:hypothetical protein